jgi:hypothetical protein
MIQVTSELFGILTIPTSAYENHEYSLDVWYSFGDYIDINVFDIGDNTIQATIYPVKNGQINTLGTLEELQGDSIKIKTLLK